MRLAVVVPGDVLDEARAELQKRVPAVVPEEVGREHPVLAVGDLVAEMGEEPGRRSCNESTCIQT
jgi:hypothetical protein